MTSTASELPTIALTVGDVAGVGPELILMGLERLNLYSTCRPVVIGPIEVLADRAKMIGLDVKLRVLDDWSEFNGRPGTIDVMVPENLPAVSASSKGAVDPATGKIAALCLETAFGLAQEGKVQGVVGAPLNKEAFRLAGYDYLDEIAYLAELTDSRETWLFGILSSLWTTCVTLHVPFKDIAGLVTRSSVLATIEAMSEALLAGDRTNPRIAVAALNPHNGEGGHMGREELDEIAPAVADARKSGIDANGPWSADTAFPRAFAEGVDGIICMYHDQANVARKLRGFANNASAFLGLPAPYATTAHGTAFDLVGTGTVDPSSFAAAVAFVVAQCGRAS